MVSYDLIKLNDEHFFIRTVLTLGLLLFIKVAFPNSGLAFEKASQNFQDAVSLAYMLINVYGV